MVKTASFFSLPQNQKHNAIIISVGVPKGFKDLPSYNPLKPFHIFKQLSGMEFAEAYRQKLNKLNPQKVWDELHALVPGEPILVCWEPPLKPCHRRLVAEWFEEHLGVKVEELGYEGQNYPTFKEMCERENVNHAEQLQLFTSDAFSIHPGVV